MAKIFSDPNTGHEVIVPDELCEKYLGAGYRQKGVIEEPKGSVPGVPDESWSLPELKKYAAESNVDVGKARSKKAILTLIEKAAESSISESLEEEPEDQSDEVVTAYEDDDDPEVDYEDDEGMSGEVIVESEDEAETD